MSAFDETSQRDQEIDEDLLRLDAELEELALEPEDGDTDDDPRDTGCHRQFSIIADFAGADAEGIN